MRGAADRPIHEHVAWAYFRDGHLTGLPSKRSRRLAALAILAERFAPSRRYAEAEVNQLLAGDAPDHATLRRQLVDEGLLSREGGTYWRNPPAG